MDVGVGVGGDAVKFLARMIACFPGKLLYAQILPGNTKWSTNLCNDRATVGCGIWQGNT